MARQPNDFRISVTCALACSSFPERKIVWSALATSDGSAITSAFTVFRALTTFAPGNARWICSPRESVFDTNRTPAVQDWKSPSPGACPAYPAGLKGGSLQVDVLR